MPTLPWSGKGFKTTPLAADYSLLVDSVSGNNLRYTFGSLAPITRATELTGLTSVNSPILPTDTILQGLGKAQGQIDDLDGGKWELVPSTTYLRPEQALGIAGLRLYNLSQSESVRTSYESNGFYFDSSDTTMKWRFWQTLQAETFIKLNNSGALNANKGISFYGLNDQYKIGFDDAGGLLGSLRYNVDTAASTHGHLFSAGTIGSSSTLAFLSGIGQLRVYKNNGWLAGVFGGVATNQVVMGSLENVPTIAGHNSALNAYSALNLRSDGNLMTVYASSFEVLSNINSYGNVYSRNIVSQNKNTYISHDAINNVGVIQSVQDGVAFRSTYISEQGGGVAFGLSRSIPGLALFHSELPAYFKSTINIDNSPVAPSAAAQGGMLYGLATGSFDNLCWIDHSDAVTNITDLKRKIITNNYNTNYGDDILLVNATEFTAGSPLQITVAANTIKRTLTIVKIAGPQDSVVIAAEIGHFISGNSGVFFALGANYNYLRLQQQNSTNAFDVGARYSS